MTMTNDDDELEIDFEKLNRSQERRKPLRIKAETDVPENIVTILRSNPLPSD